MTRRPPVPLPLAACFLGVTWLMLPACGDDDGGQNNNQNQNNANIVCGNGVQEAPEACDGTDLAGQSCTGLGYHGGSLACSDTCGFDISSCEGSLDCGDGTVGVGEVCDDGNRTDWDGCTRCEPSEFRVTESPTEIEPRPVAGVDASGRFVIAWQAFQESIDTAHLFTGRFAAGGTLEGEDERSGALIQSDAPALGVLGDGRYGLFWLQGNVGETRARLYGAAHDAQGNALGPAQAVSAFSSTWRAESPLAVPTVDGTGYRVVWLQRDTGATDDATLMTVAMGADGTLDASPVSLWTVASDYLHAPRLTRAATGFVVGWVEQPAVGDPTWAMYGRVIDPRGRPTGDPVLLWASPADSRGYAGWAMAGAADGRVLLVIVHCGDAFPLCRVLARWLDAEDALRPLGAELDLGETGLDGVWLGSASVAASSGETLVTWHRADADGGNDLWGRRLAADGTPAAPAFRVNVQDEGSHRYPSALAVPGGWVVVWRHDGVQPRGLQVNATRLSSAGEVLGVTGP